MNKEQFRAFERHCRSSETYKYLKIDMLANAEKWVDEMRPTGEMALEDFEHHEECMLEPYLEDYYRYKTIRVKGYDKDAPLTEELCYYCEELIKDCAGFNKCPQLTADTYQIPKKGEKMKDLVKTDNDMDLVEALEKRFSLHDVDMIYNVLYEFLDIDTKQGEITFLDFISKNYKEEK